MLGKTHRKIARTIAEELNLGKREASLLETGSISPDSWADFPHHKDKGGEIRRCILEARRLFLEDDDECFHRLGVALHYIQDKWTLRPRTGDQHTKWERAIDKAALVDDSKLKEAIRDLLFPTKVEKTYLAFLDKLKKGIAWLGEDEKHYNPLIVMRGHRPAISLRGLGSDVIYWADRKRPTGWSSPALDLNLAYRICRELAHYVLQPVKREDIAGSKRKRKAMSTRIERIEKRLDDFTLSYADPNSSFHKLQDIVASNEINIDAVKKYLTWVYGSNWKGRRAVAAEISHFPAVHILKEALRIEDIIENEKRKYQVILYEEKVKPTVLPSKHPGSPSKIQVYVDCNSRNVALILLEFLKLFLKKHPEPWEKGDSEDPRSVRGDSGYMEWPDLFNLAILDTCIDDEKSTMDLLGKCRRDMKNLQKLKKQLWEATDSAYWYDLEMLRDLVEHAYW